MHSDQLVSDEVTVSSDWVTITSKQPMEPVKQHQSLVLEVADPLLVDNLHPENIRFADGSVVHPEVQMVDESGRVDDVKMERALTPSRHLNSIDKFYIRDDEGTLLDEPQLVSFITSPAPNAGAAADNRASSLWGLGGSF